MTWFWLALASAAFMATGDFLLKRHFSDRPLTEAVMVRLTGLLPLGLIVFLLGPPIEWRVEPGFWWIVALAMPGEIAATLLYTRALQVSPLALTQPFMACTPLFALISGVLILGEFPSWVGVAGVVLLASGAYGLNVHQARLGWLEPFKAVTREPGSWMALVVSAIYAYTAVMGRNAIMHSSALFMAVIYPLIWACCVLTVLAVKGRLAWGWLRRPWPVAAISLCMCGMALCHFLAISMVQAAYMVAVKRMSILLALLYGGLILGEERLRQHLLAACLMVAGAVLLLVLGD